MAQNDPHSERSATLLPSGLLPTQLAEMGKKRVDATIAVQTEFFGTLQDINREWLARAQSKIDLASKLATKLTAARSFPEATTASQEWASTRMNMFAEDGRRFVADGQKLVETGVRLFSNGWTSGKT
jgi:hypothetical protein